MLYASSPMDFQDLAQDKGNGKVTLGQILAPTSSNCALFLHLICSGGTVCGTWRYCFGHGTKSPQPGGAPVAPRDGQAYEAVQVLHLGIEYGAATLVVCTY